MLRWMCGTKHTNDISTHDLCLRLCIKDLDVVLRRKRLKWFAHVQRCESRISRALPYMLRVLVLEEGHARAGGRCYRRTSGYADWSLGMLITVLCGELGQPCSIRPTSQWIADVFFNG